MMPSSAKSTFLVLITLLAFSGLDKACNASFIYVSNREGNSVDRVASDGTRTPFATGVPLVGELAFDSAGNLYVANTSNQNTVQRITPAGTVSVFATGLQGTTGLEYDPVSNVFYAVSSNSNSIVRISSSGVVTPFASGGGRYNQKSCTGV